MPAAFPNDELDYYLPPHNCIYVFLMKALLVRKMKTLRKRAVKVLYYAP